MNNYTVTAIAGEGGSITPASSVVAHGQTTTFNVIANTGYGISEASGCGGSLSGNTYTTGAVSAACTVNVSFELLPPDAPTVTLTPQSIKTFSFSWINVSRVTEYRLFENADGNSGFSELAIIDADITSYDLVVFLPARINASYVLAACNASGCTDSAPVFVSGSLAGAVGYVKASNAGEHLFGDSIALSADGTTLAVGAPGESSSATGINGDESDNSAGGSGAVYVFSRSGNSWSQQAYVKASNTDADDYFGWRITLSGDGNTLAVGTWFEDSNATGVNSDETDNSAENSGAVYVFNRNGTAWNQQAYIKASNTEASDFFGHSIALSGDGNILAVGAYGEDCNATGINGDGSNNLANNSGAVYIFSRAGAVWSQQSYVKALDIRPDNGFGRNIALAADVSTLAVGASKAIYVFSRNGTGWLQQAEVNVANTELTVSYGGDIALSADGNTLVLGFSADSSNATGINGDETNNDSSYSGAVYVFSRSGNSWSQQAYIKASNADAWDFFGSKVALSADGNTLVVGAWGEGSNATGINEDELDNSSSGSGAVYVFRRSGASWSQQAYVKATNTGEGGLFGDSIALSGDGNTLAVGSPGEASNATGIGGDQSDRSYLGRGAAYLY